MIGNDPYGIRHAVRPGYGEPEPLEPVSTRDPPQAVNRCLCCTIPITECAGNCGPVDGPKLCGRPARREKTRLRDEKIRDLINAGWVNNDAICEELKISMSTLIAAKRRLREDGAPWCIGIVFKLDDVGSMGAQMSGKEVQELIEKHTPKKPAKVNSSGVRYTSEYRCPTCGGTFTGTGIADFCYHCGQRLDWECQIDGKAH